MLRRIKIANLRGIRRGELDLASRLVVLIGPNGSGKSTALEAMFLGASKKPAAAAGLITARRTHTLNGARWVMHAGAVDAQARLETEWDDGSSLTRWLAWDEDLRVDSLTDQFVRLNAPRPYSAFRVLEANPDDSSNGTNKLQAVVAIAANNTYLPMDTDTPLEVPDIRIVDSGAREQALEELFSGAVRAGRRKEILRIVQGIVPGLEGVEILTEQGQPRLCLTFADRAVPATVAGDGVVALLHILFELVGPEGTTVLLEEPEIHQHPRSLRACARAIVESARAGVQVVMTTHSLELIDALLSELTDEELDEDGWMTILRMQLKDGDLVAGRISAAQAERVRIALAEDLR